MPSSANSSINLTGELKAYTARRTTRLVLSMILGEIEAKALEVNAPLGGSVTAVPLNLSTGVTEALFFAYYSPKPLILEAMFSDTANSGTTAGPVRFGVKGTSMMTYTPGEGLVSLNVINPSNTEDVTLEYVIAAIEKSGDVPPFWE